MKKYTLYKFYYGKYCVYLGRTAQPIADRIRGHFFAKPMHKKVEINAVTKIEIAECKSEADMYLYEIYYINLLKPMLNRDDKACDELSIALPELKFMEYEPKLLEKWKTQIAGVEKEKERKQQVLIEWQCRYSEARKILKGDSWYDWLDKNPRPA